MSVLCLLLQDSNEPVRNEAILLLMAVANDNFNIQNWWLLKIHLKHYLTL